MRYQPKGWHWVLLGVSCLPLIFTLLLIPFNKMPTYEHRIVFQPPGCAMVVQQGTMVLMFGDYIAHLRAFNADVLNESFAASLSELLGRESKPAMPEDMEEPPPIQVAGFALLYSNGPGALFDSWFGRVDWVDWDGPTLCLIRFRLNRLAMMLSIPPLVILGLLYLRAKLARRRESAGICAQCGYDIRATAEARCPECGAAFGPIALAAFEHRAATARFYELNQEDNAK